MGGIMEVTMEKYCYLKKVNHHFWVEKETGRIVISDESADNYGVGNPEHTDSGVRYLDTEALSKAEINKAFFKFIDRDTSLYMPIITVDGKKEMTLASKKEMIYAIKLSKQ
jgi:hypothetical protein